MYQALYRKYRPKSFNDVIGQDVIVRTLSNSVLNDKISHAYLFTGPRGTGKTSIAKILAKIVNCENLNGLDVCNNCVSCTQKYNTDIIEIDAASNNGVDEIRDLRDKVNLVPSYGKYKVYIIDEVHMLTISAFNALLKTLEEPPKHIIFILATTEPHKIPNTILSRCQRFDFKKISTKNIEERLKYICKEEKIKIDSEALELVAKLSDGGMRDSINLLDQLTAYTDNKITIEDVNDVCGILTKQEIYDFLNLVINNNLVESFKSIEKFDSDGKNLAKILDEIIDFLKDTLIFCNNSDYFDAEEKKYYSDLCKSVPENKIYEIIEIILEKIKTIKTTNNVKLIFELSVIKIVELLKNNVIEESFSDKKNEIPIYEEKKIIPKKNISPKKISSKLIEKLQNLKKIRINNALSKFEKKELLAFKKELDKVNEYLLDPEFSSYVSIIADGELKVKGNNNLIFVYDVKNLEERFNLSLIHIEKLLEKVFGVSYKPIAISIDEWNIIKNEFNNNKKAKVEAYKYIDEPCLEEIFNEEVKVEEKEDLNEIENLFSENIEYN